MEVRPDGGCTQHLRIGYHAADAGVVAGEGGGHRHLERVAGRERLAARIALEGRAALDGEALADLDVGGGGDALDAGFGADGEEGRENDGDGEAHGGGGGCECWLSGYDRRVKRE